MKRIDLKTGAGTIAAFVTASARPVGVLVCVHGGPGGDHHGNNNIFDEIREYAPDLGYSVVQFDMYGSGSSEGTQADVTLATQVADLEATLAFVRASHPVPLHIVGESMGATIAALRWAPDAASYTLLWPAFDLRDTDLRPYFADHWLSVARAKGRIEDSGIVIGRAFIEELCLHDFSSCFALPPCPCLLVHGHGDTAVPFEQSLRAVREARGEAVLFAHPTGDHGLQTPS